MAEFPTTQWTQILASRGDAARQRALLEALLARTWQPLYLFLRRRGLPRAEAEDALQSFAVHLLETQALQRLDPARGRLRAYLKTALQHHASHAREKDAAAKRGGGKLVALDADAAEALLVASPETPDAAFDRAWAQAVFQRALERLRAEHESQNRAGPFEVIADYFRGNEAPLAEVAARFGMGVPQLKSTLHRARARFRALLAEEVAGTAAPDEVEHELAELLRCL